MPASLDAHTFGSVLRGWTFDGIAVEEVLMPAGLQVTTHAHEAAQLYFVLEGGYVERCRNGAHALPPGAMWMRPAREPHANAVIGSNPALTLIVSVEPPRLAGFECLASRPGHLQSLLLDEVRSQIVRELRREDAAAATALEGWSLLLLSRAERLFADGADGVPEWLGDATRFIDRAWDQPIALATVAAHVNVHPSTLAAAFRRFHGTSVGEAIRHRRLERARDALLGSNRPIKEIAATAGFYDQAHFGRCFRAHFGITPAAARRRGTTR